MPRMLARNLPTPCTVLLRRTGEECDFVSSDYDTEREVVLLTDAGGLVHDVKGNTILYVTDVRDGPIDLEGGREIGAPPEES